MQMELSTRDLRLLNTMLDKELGETRVEIRHADNADYKNCLKDREKEINSLLEKVSANLPKTG